MEKTKKTKQKKLKKPYKTNIGGQAVIEGVMMRGTSSMATAVRDDDGIIRVETKRLKPLKSKNFLFRTPIIRGALNFFASMVTGVKTLLRSAEVFGGEEPTKFDQWVSKKFKIDVMSIVMFVGVALGLGLSILLFVICPQLLTNLIATPTAISKTSFWFNLIEGLIRITIFVLYIYLTSLLKDIKRTYMYHGAEHKTISCYEQGLELTVENVKTCPRVHDRCGTTFMFFVMFVSILVFSIANSFAQLDGILRILFKIALLPLVAGLSYELLKGLAKTESWIVYPIKLPGLLLQKLTTKEPTNEMIEVSITAFKTVLEMDKNLDIETKEFITPKKVGELTEQVTDILKKAGIDETSEAEWIISLVSGIKRSDLEENKQFIFSPKSVEKVLNYANERAKTKKPLWYIFGDTEFYGRKIFVDERVLIPRPETEELCLYALKEIKDNSTVLDLCTGSGAIAVTIALESKAKTFASDISEKALEVARKNADNLKANVEFIQSDFFKNIDNKFDVIISNPPYIKSADIDTLSDEVKCEPKLALDGGIDGLDCYRNIALNSKNHLNENGILFMEIGFEQGEDIKEIFKNDFDVEIIKDINGLDRIVKAKIK